MRKMRTMLRDLDYWTTELEKSVEAMKPHREDLYSIHHLLEHRDDPKELIEFQTITTKIMVANDHLVFVRNQIKAHPILKHFFRK